MRITKRTVASTFALVVMATILMTASAVAQTEQILRSFGHDLYPNGGLLIDSAGSI